MHQGRLTSTAGDRSRADSRKRSLLKLAGMPKDVVGVHALQGFADAWDVGRVSNRRNDRDASDRLRHDDLQYRAAVFRVCVVPDPDFLGDDPAEGVITDDLASSRDPGVAARREGPFILVVDRIVDNRRTEGGGLDERPRRLSR